LASANGIPKRWWVWLLWLVLVNDFRDEWPSLDIAISYG
jgi:hypothetical protein